MAKESMKAREVKRAKLVAKYAAKRAELKVFFCIFKRQSKFSQESIPFFVCFRRGHKGNIHSGRPKGYVRQFGISRIQLREMASHGLIPGVKKASW